MQILWYNKSRLTSRICPSCRRLYNLGQALPDLIEDGEDEEEGGAGAYDEQQKPHPHAPPNPLLEREQMISGLCELILSPSHLCDPIIPSAPSSLSIPQPTQHPSSRSSIISNAYMRVKTHPTPFLPSRPPPHFLLLSTHPRLYKSSAYMRVLTPGNHATPLSPFT